MWRFHDLLLYSGAVYGLAWLLTRSHLLRPLRDRLAPVPYLGPLVRCIVCTGAWVALAVLLASPRATLFSDSFVPRSAPDVVILVGWALFSTWALGRALGDAD